MGLAMQVSAVQGSPGGTMAAAGQAELPVAEATSSPRKAELVAPPAVSDMLTVQRAVLFPLLLSSGSRSLHVYLTGKASYHLEITDLSMTELVGT